MTVGMTVWMTVGMTVGMTVAVVKHVTLGDTASRRRDSKVGQIGAKLDKSGFY